MVVEIILGVIAVVVLFLIVLYNGLVKLRNQIEEAFSTMDVHLKKRYDLIPNIVETIKGYTTHETETLQNVTNARTTAMGAQSVNDKIKAEGELAGALKSLFAVSENYPDLKANENFMQLQNTLQTVEEDISMARSYYNGAVKNFNDKLLVFPNNVIAPTFGFKKAEFYELDDVAQRENIQIKF